MKKNYVRPTMIGEKFAANEYVAACGESGVTYKFQCNATKKLDIFTGGLGDVYLETNGIEGLQTSGQNPDAYLGQYYHCEATHIAESTDPFLEGYYDPVGFIDANVKKVIVWRGENNDNIHCTTNLDQTTWETGKS